MSLSPVEAKLRAKLRAFKAVLLAMIHMKKKATSANQDASAKQDSSVPASASSPSVQQGIANQETYLASEPPSSGQQGIANQESCLVSEPTSSGQQGIAIEESASAFEPVSSGQQRIVDDEEGMVRFKTEGQRAREAKKVALAKAKANQRNNNDNVAPSGPNTVANANDVNANNAQAVTAAGANAEANANANTNTNINANVSHADIVSHPSFDSVTTIESAGVQTPTTPASIRSRDSNGPLSSSVMYTLRLPEDLDQPVPTAVAAAVLRQVGRGGLRRTPVCMNINLLRTVMNESNVSSDRVAFYEYWLRFSTQPVEYAWEHGRLPLPL